MTTPAEPPPLDPDDPFSVHFHREPLGLVGVSIVALLDASASPETSAAWQESVAWLRAEGRPVELIFKAVDPTAPRLGAAIQEAAEAASQPIVAIATTAAPPGREHWGPLLKALDQADHVWARRPSTTPTSVGRWMARAVRRLVFGVPLWDVHAPLSLHRVERLRAIPLQSGSSFVDVELPAKATFLGHVLDEAAVPPLAGTTWSRGRFRDLRLVFKTPTFHREPTGIDDDSRPLEPAQGEPERADGPGGEDRQDPEDFRAADPGALQDDQAQALDELRQG